MGSRPSQFKKGGGFLNGVDLTLADYQWTDEFNGEPYVAGKMKDSKGKTMEKPHSLYMALSVRVDGADEDTTTTIRAGNYDNYEVSEDGHTLTAAEGGPCSISDKCAVAKFIGSLCKPIGGGDGFPEDSFSDDPDSIDFSPMLGTRCRTVQKTDAERTKEFGKRKGKDGKEYERQDLVVEQVYEVPGTKQVSKPATTTKTAKVVTKAAGGKPNGKVQEVDVAELAGVALQEMLAKSGSPLLKTKLSVLTLSTPALKGNPAREDVRKFLANDENLEALVEAGVIASYDRASKQIEAVE